MKTVALTGESRPTLGTKDARALRNEGKVPCVLYGGKEHLHFFVYAPDFKALVYTPNTYKVQLTIEGKKHLAILQDMQFHPVNETIIHADFLAIDEVKPVVLSIPIKVAGISPGVRAGGKLIQKIQRIKVRSIVGNIPDYVEVNIDALDLGQSIKVKEISIPNVEILDAQENAVISVKMTRNVVKEEAAPAKK
ncbi:MAG: 50S ribosomal protein L25/general stress protein Ctc [Bacteroidetes bacterium]|nr:50S ribosomal protein L25/general stress protein Ctc [Bacteroidota bacterium]